jgi:asparagine synthase (glutamine-hydrolysing)
LRSDVTVGIALSGGIDSSAIAALAQKYSSDPMHAVCVGYPGHPPYDERQQARSLAARLGMIVHDVEVPVKDFVSFLPSLVRIMDEPIADPASYAHYCVPRAASEHGIKVLLSGIGGDELFWGYSWARHAAASNKYSAPIGALLSLLAPIITVTPAGRILEKLASSPRCPYQFRRLASQIRDHGIYRSPRGQLSFYVGVPEFNDVRRLKGTFYGPQMRGISLDTPFIPTALEVPSECDTPIAIIRLLFATWLASNCLTLGDRLSMSVGVETRLPFLDTQLIELVMSWRRIIPDHGLDGKAWLRTALRGTLPDNVLSRPKAGFQPPVRDWLSAAVAAYGNLLPGGVLAETGVLDQKRSDYVAYQMPRLGWATLFIAYKLVLLEMWSRDLLTYEH